MPLRVAFIRDREIDQNYLDNSRTLDGFINENSKQEKLQSKL